MLVPSGLNIEVQTAHRRIKQARIVPRIGYYVVEVAYEQQEATPSGNPALYAAVDLGVDTLAALTSNKVGFAPRLVTGRVLKSYNQFYNKRRAELQEALGHEGTTARLERLTTKRTRRINHYLHAASKTIIVLLVAEGIGTLVIGKNLLWKQEVELGRVNNQHFVQIPHARFIDMLSYKAELAGIWVIVQEESYTSKASFLDLDPIPDYTPKREDKPVFSGKRVERGLYRTKAGRRIQADVNGSYNIGRKALPNSFGQGIEPAALRPPRLAAPPTTPPARACRRRPLLRGQPRQIRAQVRGQRRQFQVRDEAHDAGALRRMAYRRQRLAQVGHLVREIVHDAGLGDGDQRRAWARALQIRRDPVRDGWRRLVCGHLVQLHRPRIVRAQPAVEHQRHLGVARGVGDHSGCQRAARPIGALQALIQPDATGMLEH